MKAIVRPSHNGGKTHVYVSYDAPGLNKVYQLYRSLCSRVVRRTFYSDVKPQTERKIECAKCERLAKKLDLFS